MVYTPQSLLQIRESAIYTDHSGIVRGQGETVFASVNRKCYFVRFNKIFKKKRRYICWRIINILRFSPKDTKTFTIILCTCKMTGNLKNPTLSLLKLSHRKCAPIHHA